MELTHNGTSAVFTVKIFYFFTESYMSLLLFPLLLLFLLLHMTGIPFYHKQSPFLLAAQQLKSIISITNCLTGYVQEIHCAMP